MPSKQDSLGSNIQKLEAASRVPPKGVNPCKATHPQTGEQCWKPEGHDIGDTMITPTRVHQTQQSGKEWTTENK